MSDAAAPFTPARVARAVLITIALVAMAHLLWRARDLLFILFFGVLIALFLSVFVDRLQDAGLPRVPSVLLVLLALVLLFGGAGWLLWPIVSDQLSVVAQDMPQAIDRAGDWFESQYDAVRDALGAPPAEVEEQLRTRLSRQAGTLVSGALPVLNSALGAIAGVLVVLVTGIYIAVDPRVYRKGFLRLLPPKHRDRVDQGLRRSAGTLRRWMIGTAINMVIVGVLVAIGLWIIGVPAAIALAVIAGLFEFIPIFGPILSSVPAIAVALTVSPITALWVVLLYIVVQQLEGNVITPIVMKGAVELPPALTLLFQAFMGIIFGFLGLLLAVPILAAGLVLVQELYVKPLEARESG